MSKKRIINLAILLTMASIVFFAVPAESAVVKNANKTAKSKIAAEPSGVRNPGPLFAKSRAARLGKLNAKNIEALTNMERAENGNLRPLYDNEVLNEVAQKRLKDMFKKQYFAHVSPSGLAPSEVASTSGYAFLNFGENIAMGNFKDDADMVKAWMNSPAHRANILDKNYKEIGVAVGKGMYKGKLTWIAVQSFGRPKPNCDLPDESLPKIVYDDNTLIVNLKKEAQTIRDSLRAVVPQSQSDVEVFNKKVVDYNALVRQINNLIDEAKTAKDKYNSQVDDYNKCIQQ